MYAFACLQRKYYTLNDIGATYGTVAAYRKSPSTIPDSLIPTHESGATYVTVVALLVVFLHGTQLPFAQQFHYYTAKPTAVFISSIIVFRQLSSQLFPWSAQNCFPHKLTPASISQLQHHCHSHLPHIHWQANFQQQIFSQKPCHMQGQNQQNNQMMVKISQASDEILRFKQKKVSNFAFNVNHKDKAVSNLKSGTRIYFLFSFHPSLVLFIFQGSHYTEVRFSDTRASSPTISNKTIIKNICIKNRAAFGTKFSI